MSLFTWGSHAQVRDAEHPAGTEVARPVHAAMCWAAVVRQSNGRTYSCRKRHLQGRLCCSMHGSRERAAREFRDSLAHARAEGSKP